MLGFGLPELIVILAVALLIVGPTRLPLLGSALGGAIKSFRKGVAEPKVLGGNGKIN